MRIQLKKKAQVRKKLVTVFSPSSSKCLYPYCELSIPVMECQNKVVNTKCDGWLQRLCQISHDGKFCNNKFEDKFGLRTTCFSCFNKILYALDEELNENNEISNNYDDASIMVMCDDKGDSDSSFSVSSNFDNEEDDEDISLNKKGKTCNIACDKRKNTRKVFANFV